MTADNRSPKPSQRPRVVAQQAAGKWVLLDVDSGRYFALDEVGGRIWHLCDGSRTVDEIAAVIATEYDGSVPAIAMDVAALVSELSGESLLA